MQGRGEQFPRSEGTIRADAQNELFEAVEELLLPPWHGSELATALRTPSTSETGPVRGAKGAARARAPRTTTSTPTGRLDRRLH
jgi:hypothetical protein